MSRASKITFALSTLFTVASVVMVYDLQESEREAIAMGPVKDAKRVKEKEEDRLKEQLAKERKKELNRLEHLEQIELKKKYESMQPLSNVTLTAEDE
ncbi:Pet117p ASCRUDRAFT_35143 [Ascoidea rubescens DSM 1968]|uniref:Cytochrome c oxidase assembly protein n=1 Tax=Ascoidea rubescens DSM 1968 TaxID=1344418 RepID=A0A1D2VGU8_9ASCO|nr:hypothetical protein ASCRUDRAFT_35143 [Ascoidea rubescens DSM 1968]ODV60713.1 hypothetical protein ASCRUDRAFT_35143 [Ascoidea rubescens DSM 1968]